MQIRGNFRDFFFEDALPALHKVALDEYSAYPTLYTECFNVETSDRSIEQDTEVSGVGLLAPIAETEAIATDQPTGGYNKTYRHAKYGLAIPTSQEMIEDDKWRLVSASHQALGRSTKETQELQAWGIFNNGFATNGYDGVPLFSASHPLVKVGGVQSNIGTSADLDDLSLKAALTQFETMRDHAGLLIRVQPRKLIVATDNRWMAMQLTRNPNEPFTANNNVNTLKHALDGMPTPMVVPYLTDPDAWFLTAEPRRTKLMWFWRKRPYPKTWFEDPREVGYYAMRYRASWGWSGYLGVWGNPGA
jgi:hypothetical protein